MDSYSRKLEEIANEGQIFNDDEIDAETASKDEEKITVYEPSFPYNL